jgi:8-oxo-dGTP diphosphatase
MVGKQYPDAPRVGVGAIIFHNNKILLVFRGSPPSQYMWAIPGGRVELGETMHSAVERETLEETGLRVKAGEVVFTFDVIQHDDSGRIQYHFVILDMLATLIDPTQPLTPGDDAKDARWFTLEEINHPDLPISTTTRSLLNKLMA